MPDGPDLLETRFVLRLWNASGGTHFEPMWCAPGEAGGAGGQYEPRGPVICDIEADGVPVVSFTL